MFPNPLTRRTFMNRSAAAAAGLFLSSCFGDRVSTAPTPRPSYGRLPRTVETRWPVKHVVYLMLENRSFDNLFGRYPGARGTSVGVRWGQQVPLVRCPEWLPGDLPHDLAAWRTSYNDGWMDGFVGEYGPFYAYSQFARDDIPNYYAWTKDFVLNDNTFASAAGLSFPRNPQAPNPAKRIAIPGGDQSPSH
jgi:phospholipase C